MDKQVWSPTVELSLYLCLNIKGETAGACKVHQEKITNALKNFSQKMQMDNTTLEI